MLAIEVKQKTAVYPRQRRLFAYPFASLTSRIANGRPSEHSSSRTALHARFGIRTRLVESKLCLLRFFFWIATKSKSFFQGCGIIATYLS